MQTEKLQGRFDCKIYNPKLPKEQWKFNAEDGNITLTVTYSIDQLPDMFKVNGQPDEFCKLYASREEKSHAQAENRQPAIDRVAIKFKVGASCKWFNAKGMKMDKPGNEDLDGKPVQVMVDFARKDKKQDNPLAPCGYWANAIMIKFEDECPFAGKEFEPMDEIDEEPTTAEQVQKQTDTEDSNDLPF